jgi:DNA-binding protein YbaB
MLDKLENIKKQTEESNKRLLQMSVTEKSENSEVSISMNGHRTLTEFNLNESYKDLPKDDLEDLIYLTFNKALDRVNKINEEEVMSSAKSLFPGF